MFHIIYVRLDLLVSVSFFRRISRDLPTVAALHGTAVPCDTVNTDGKCLLTEVSCDQAIH